MRGGRMVTGVLKAGWWSFALDDGEGSGLQRMSVSVFALKTL